MAGQYKLNGAQKMIIVIVTTLIIEALLTKYGIDKGHF